jgi:hypothetical protein
MNDQLKEWLRSQIETTRSFEIVTDDHEAKKFFAGKRTAYTEVLDRISKEEMRTHAEP